MGGIRNPKAIPKRSAHIDGNQMLSCGPPCGRESVVGVKLRNYLHTSMPKEEASTLTVGEVLLQHQKVRDCGRFGQAFSMAPRAKATSVHSPKVEKLGKYLFLHHRAFFHHKDCAGLSSSQHLTNHCADDVLV